MGPPKKAGQERRGPLPSGVTAYVPLRGPVPFFEPPKKGTKERRVPCRRLATASRGARCGKDFGGRATTRCARTGRAQQTRRSPSRSGDVRGRFGTTRLRLRGLRGLLKFVHWSSRRRPGANVLGKQATVHEAPAFAGLTTFADFNSLLVQGCRSAGPTDALDRHRALAPLGRCSPDAMRLAHDGHQQSNA